MKSARKVTKVIFTFLGLIVLTGAIKVDHGSSNLKRQVGSDKGLILDSTQDREADASGFLGSAAVQAHSKYFQDFFTVQLAPHKLEFGHVCENPDDWEQRYERKDFKNHRDQGKVRWGDKHGGYGEHYWDFNHAGHGDSHDEGSEAVADYQNYDEVPSPSINRERRHHHHQQEETPKQVHVQRPKEQQPKPQLVMDPTTGQIFDKITGKKYILQQVD